MKFRCERDVLAEAFGTAARAVASRSALPVLSGVRLVLSGEDLRLTGSDLDLTIDVATTVARGEDGTCVLPARLVGDILKAVEPGAVSISIEGATHVVVIIGRCEPRSRVGQLRDEVPALF